jgi:hypothetical protein
MKADLPADASRDETEGKLAKGVQVRGPEKSVGRAGGLRPQVHLPVAEALEQFIRWKVNQHDLVCEFEDGVGNRLPHAHPGDLRDDVVQALHVLDVDRRANVYTRFNQLTHILPPLRVTRSRGIGMR